MKIGYERVSTKSQCESLDQQIRLLKKSDCVEVYYEVISQGNCMKF
jgi:DNA invertase Pin-like site-specific DNA recombinase